MANHLTSAMDLLPTGTVARTAIYAILPILLVGLVLGATYLGTTWRYYRAMRTFSDAGPGGQQIVTPPHIPYAIPFLGHSISFMSGLPGSFWDRLFKWHPRSTGVCTLLIGGRTTHFVYSATAVQAMFRAKSPSRESFEHDMWRLVFRLPEEQAHNAETTKGIEHETNTLYMTNFERV